MMPDFINQTADTIHEKTIRIRPSTSVKIKKGTRSFDISYTPKSKPYIPELDSLANQNIYLYIKNITLEETISVMKKTINALLKNIEYNSYYNAFLLGQLSEKEFEKISDSFAMDYDNSEAIESIENEIEVLLNTIGKDFTPSDIADIFSITDEKAESILKKQNR